MGNKAAFKLQKTLNALSEERRVKTARLQRLFNQFDSGNKGWLSKADMIKMGCKARRRDSDFLDEKNPMKFALFAPSPVSLCEIKSFKIRLTSSMLMVMDKSPKKNFSPVFCKETTG